MRDERRLSSKRGTEEDTMSVTVETTASGVPLPLPTHFSHAEQSFSLKKRHVPFSLSPMSNSPYSSPARLSRSLPPLPPSKGCPPLSRMFPQHPSPWTPLSGSLSKSPCPNSVYDPSKQQSYFSQCFTNLGLLGRGSFGEVYKVQSNEDGRQYAVKRSAHRFRGNSERNRSVREARNHERLCPHPHILYFVAAWEECGRLYIQTELCSTSLLLHAEDQPPGTGLSTELQTVLQMMLAPEPSERPTVSELLDLPSVRKHRWKRRIYLMVTETVLTLASLFQLVVCFGCRLLSSHLSFLPRWTKPVPCTPPKDSWDRDLTLSLSAMHADSGSPEDDAVFLLDHTDAELSPNFSHSLVQTPCSVRSNGSCRTLTPSASPIHTGLHMESMTEKSVQSRESSSTKSSQRRGHNWVQAEEALPRPNFEPKNLLSLFEETSFEEQP
ncbi:hypothetical protein F2P81_022282 [Scophthalmus maximus]|uniref:non-specific serine/threonine protein kinase n=1 Tax=Scophthalmus maximus TaxID=52904 RepID=A0A6A4S2K5_SCOMX|nr:hypothetical protein F2P81_022282 [Scophthalmus maximus]